MRVIKLFPIYKLIKPLSECFERPVNISGEILNK